MCHLVEDHRTDVESLKGMVTDFLAAQKPLTKGSSVVLPQITEVKDVTCVPKTGFKEKFGLNKNAQLPSEDSPEIPFYEFTLENPETGDTGFALTCGDVRVGNIIAIAETGHLEEIPEFQNLFYSKLSEYVAETVDIYNGVTDEEVKDIKTSIAQDGGSQALTRDGTVGLEFANWIYNSGDAVDLSYRTWWGQGWPYNTVVNEEIGDGESYPVGCVATAIAQIMAYHEWPTWSNLEGYEEVEYVWSEMKSERKASNLPYDMVDARNAIATLMREIGVNVNMNYTILGSGAAPAYYIPCFNAMGYIAPNESEEYNYASIQVSIQQDSPVMIWGWYYNVNKEKNVGHAWVVDGYANMSCNMKVNGYVVPVLVTADYVHCNLGWNGSCNGYYRDGVFDTRNVPHPDYLYFPDAPTGTASSYYDLNVTILTNISR